MLRHSEINGGWRSLPALNPKGKRKGVCKRKSTCRAIAMKEHSPRQKHAKAGREQSKESLSFALLFFGLLLTPPTVQL